MGNSWAGWPPAAGIAPYLMIRATVTGPVDPVTGYLCNISAIDRAVREGAIPCVRQAWLERQPTAVPCEEVLGAIWPILADALPAGADLVWLELAVTPFLRYGLGKGGSAMISVTQSFEFSAAHRLHCQQLDADENRRIFGKCNNPNGHGHNYVVEVTVRGNPETASGLVIEIPRFEEVVKQQVIDPLDHKHLNRDCEEFAAVNPSVENITAVIWDKLDGQFGGAELAAVRVYETPKTWAERRRED